VIPFTPIDPLCGDGKPVGSVWYKSDRTPWRVHQLGAPLSTFVHFIQQSVEFFGPFIASLIDVGLHSRMDVGTHGTIGGMVAVEKAVGMREMRPYGFEVGHGEARLFW
jgi:hypothetical protein